MAAGMTATKPITPAITPSLELASTSSLSRAHDRRHERRLRHDVRLLQHERDEDEREQAQRVEANARSSAASTTRAAAIELDHRAPTAGGPVDHRSDQRGDEQERGEADARGTAAPAHRAALGSMLRNSESASATSIAASPPIIAAWVMASRRNLDVRLQRQRHCARGCVTRSSLRDAPAQGWSDPRSPLATRIRARDQAALELVAEAADRDDARRVGRVGLDLRPQALDVDVERLGVADVVAAPHPVDQRLARQHPTGVGEQQVEQLELLQRQRQRLAARRTTVCSSGSSDDVADADRRRAELAGRRRRATGAARRASGRPARGCRYGLVT